MITLFLDGRQGYCYTTRTRGGYCRNPLHMKLSKKDCCCGVNMGQGWGDECMRCPLHGEGKKTYSHIYIHLYSVSNDKKNKDQSNYLQAYIIFCCIVEESIRYTIYDLIIITHLKIVWSPVFYQSICIIKDCLLYINFAFT